MIKTKLKIRTFGDPCLRKKATPVKVVGMPERMLIEVMLNTISAKETDIGLAATQVGIPRQIFVVDLENFPRVFVDPKITKAEGEETMEEGCLSLPGMTFKVTRPCKVWLDYIDINNKKCHLVCEGFYARVVCHENDHLQGKLIVDYATKEDKEKNRDALTDLENKTKQLLKSDT